jgi:hypothetical protein
MAMPIQNGQTYKLFVKVKNGVEFIDRFGNIYCHNYDILLAPVGVCLLISARITEVCGADPDGAIGHSWFKIDDVMVLKSVLESKI